MRISENLLKIDENMRDTLLHNEITNQHSALC